MNRVTARKLSKIIKNSDVLEMFQKAKDSIKDWSAPTRFNPELSWGVAWNIFAARFDVNKTYPELWYRNALILFGKWLTIKPYMQSCLPVPKEKAVVKVCHQKPNFENYK